MAARPNVGGWLKGTTVRKGAGGTASTASSSRSHTPSVQNTGSTGVFAGGVKDPSGRTAEYFAMDDQCPVCKSDRYLNPKLRLLVSSCYHKMCESCIDRLFTLGPAPCPICNKVLRKLAFMPQTFEDLGVEKEVAIRRRIAKEFNKRREDFDSLRAYNDYLEEVEDITFNLINDIDLPGTEARIAAYRAANAALTASNAALESAAAQALRESEDLARQERLLRARALASEDQSLKAARERERTSLIDTLAGAQDADEAVRAVEKLKRAHALQQQQQQQLQLQQQSQSRSRLLGRRAAVPDAPHVPLQDAYDAYDDRYALLPAYDDPWSEPVRRDRDGVMRAGGYRVEEAWERAVRSAVAGLDVLPLSGLADGKGAVVGVGVDKGGDVVMASA